MLPSVYSNIAKASMVYRNGIYELWSQSRKRLVLSFHFRWPMFLLSLKKSIGQGWKYKLLPRNTSRKWGSETEKGMKLINVPFQAHFEQLEINPKGHLWGKSAEHSSLSGRSMGLVQHVPSAAGWRLPLGMDEH